MSITTLPGRFTKSRARAHKKPAYSGFPTPDSMTATEPYVFADPPDIQDDGFYSGVYDSADSGSDAIEQQVTAALVKLRSIVTMEQLAEAIKSNALDQVLEGVDFKNFETNLQNALRVTILAIVDASGTESAKLLQDQVAGAPAPPPEDHQKSDWRVQYSPSSQAAVDWAKQYTANLVSQVTDETRAAIRGAVVAGIAAGKTNAGRRGKLIGGIAKDIHPLIGLTSQQSSALGTYRTQLEDQALPQPQIDRLVLKKSGELLRARAELIAKTEGIKAMNQGQYFTWQQAVADKTLNPSYSRRIWVTYGDEKVCPVCQGLSHQIVKMDEPFVDLNDAPLMTPPGHPRCRCRQSLTFEAPESTSASEESLIFFNPNHDAKGEFSSGGHGGFALHQSNVNEVFQKLDKKAKGGAITESAAYHAGKELKEHVKAALADPSMSAEEHAHLSHELESQIGMSSKKIAEGGTMSTMRTLQGNYTPGIKIANHTPAKLVKSEPKASEGFALHQKALNDAFAGLDAKAKDGVISDHNLYHEGKALKQAAAFAVADTSLTAGERAHINTQLKAHTGMTAEEIVNASQIKVRDSLSKNYSPGKKIADIGFAKLEPSGMTADEAHAALSALIAQHTSSNHQLEDVYESSEYKSSTNGGERASMLKTATLQRLAADKVTWDKALDILSVKDPAAYTLRANFKALNKSSDQPGMSKSYKDSLLSGKDTINKLVSAGVAGSTTSVYAVREGNGRSFYQPGLDEIHMSNADPTVVVHEIGHHVEYSNPALAESAQRFYARRTAGEPLITMNQASRSRAYRPDEVTRPDKFMNAYIGKTYGSAHQGKTSEVVSMGLEHMSSLAKLKEFIAKDPDHFKFMYNAMREIYE